MEVYGPSTFPTTDDYTLDVDKLVCYFGLKHRAYLKHPTNKYLFSFCNDWFTISPIRKEYRIIGRVHSFTPIKRTIDFDVFFQGSKVACIEMYTSYLRTYLMSI